MLDTVALTLDQHEFVIREPERFSPPARGVLSHPYYPLGPRGNFSCVLNPTNADRAAGRYVPRLTLTRRKGPTGFGNTLRIEFSAPKLLFGNNFDELSQEDFHAVLGALSEALNKLG